jgi:hypothetical protein
MPVCPDYYQGRREVFLAHTFDHAHQEGVVGGNAIDAKLLLALGGKPQVVKR